MGDSRRAWSIAFALAVVAFAASLVVGHAFFEHLSVNNDEAVYVLEAETLGSGQLTLSDSAHGDAFRPWMSGRVEGDRLVLVEQPILPALMAASDIVFGTMRVAVAIVAVGAVLSIFALARTLLGDDRVALAAAACFVLSPLVIVQSAMYLSYVLAVALAATVLTLVTHGLDRLVAGRPARWWLLGAGVVHGVLLFTRPLEGLVLALVICVWMGVRRVDARTFVGTALLLVAGALPVVALGLLYNELTTGDPFLFPLWTIGGDDSFGFGRRAVAEHAAYIEVGPREAWLALRMNLRAFPHWLAAGLVSIPVAGWGAWRLWHTARRVLYLLATMVAAYPFAYFFYYGNYLIIGGRMLYGPHYYLALLIPSTILVGAGLVDLFVRRRTWAYVVVAAAVVATAIQVPDKVRRNLDVRDDVAAEVAAVDAAVEEPAVVIVPAGVDGPYVLHPRGALGNPPDLDAPTLFAADLGGGNLDLADRFPDRHLYRLQTVTTSDGFVPRVEPLDVVRGDKVVLRASSQPALGHPDSVAYVNVGEQSVPCATDGRIDAVRVVLGPTGAIVAGCGGPARTFTVPQGALTLTFGFTSLAPGAAGGGGAVEVRYWARTGPAGVAVMTPAQLWLRHAGSSSFEVLDPALVPRVATSVEPAEPVRP